MARRHILHAPDYVANAGGLISIYAEMQGASVERATELALEIEDSVDSVLAEVGQTSPMDAAEAIARRRLACA